MSNSCGSFPRHSSLAISSSLASAVVGISRPEHNRGNIIALSNDGKSLWATVELIGKDAPRIAASNSVSIFAEPEWKDTYGNTYQWPIRHLLLTPDPRIPGLKGFMPIAANNTTIHVPVLRYQQQTNPNEMPGIGTS